MPGPGLWFRKNPDLGPGPGRSLGIDLKLLSRKLPKIKKIFKKSK